MFSLLSSHLALAPQLIYAVPFITLQYYKQESLEMCESMNLNAMAFEGGVLFV